ncbi:hypothetical protein Pfo_029210 [Paulownia fortunei]|nr:hypothetical protein Pfo_029210 [Paulownia fortunei]
MSMNILVWNIRGIGNTPSQKHLHSFCQLHRIKILVIIEPKVHLDNHFFCRRLGFSKVIANCSNKIWCFVDFDFDMEVLLDHEQLLHIRISSQQLPAPFLLSGICAKCDITRRRELWEVIRQITDKYNPQPWLLGGDFNTILHPQERTGRNDCRMTSLNDFSNMILDCGLIDAGYDGNGYTWTNKKVWKRLDRMLYSESWLDLCHSTRVSHLTRTWSDHAPLLTSVCFHATRVPSSFRFLKMWTRHRLFLDDIKSSWQPPTGSTGMINLQQKLYRLKHFLKRWNKEVFGNIFDNIRKAEQEVAGKEQNFDENPSDSNLIALKRSTAILTQALTIEEEFWKQKAACRWIVEGERNTKFFQSLVKKKCYKSRIHSILQEGTIISDPEEIKSSATSFFHSLLSNDIPNLLNDELDCIQPLPPGLDTKTLHSFPVAGPDGFSAHFYQFCWDIISTDVKEAVEDFFRGNEMPRSFTATTLVLIPKSENPSTWSDYRPVNLCNVSNKIISKILSNRLSGFVWGRLISDNILLAQELIHTINAKQKQENVVLKIDMSKAYDRVQWSFLYKILHKMGFPDFWIKLIQHCIENCWFSVLINGSTAGFFQSSRGLRQGDPLSPSLFIITSDFLSRSLDKMFQQHTDMHYFSNGGLRISHLSYADDIIIFTNSSVKGLRRLMKFLQHYNKVSGQNINTSKSSFTVSKRCSNLIIQRLQFITGFSLKHLPITYLGTPFTRATKKRRLQGWEKMTLSHGGRLALIKSTLTTIPIYLMQVLQPPKTVIHSIEQIMARFFWGSYGAQRRMHWASWDNICNPYEEGGLGIRKMADLIKTFSYKMWWRFREQSSLWAEFMFQKYCGCIFPGMVKISVHDSAIWKRMCSVRKEVQNLIFWNLGNGNMDFWHDHWTGDADLASILQRNSAGYGAVNFFWRNGQRNVNMLQQHLPSYMVNRISQIPIVQNCKDLLGSLWCPHLTPTISVFLWRLLHNWIPVDNRLQEKGFALASKCFCCASASESIQHLFISGAQAKEVWNHFAALFKIQTPLTNQPILLIQYWKHSTPYSSSSHIRTLIPFLILWCLWTERNDAKHRNKGFKFQRVIWKVYLHLFCLSKCRRFDRTSWRGDIPVALHLNIHFPPVRSKKMVKVNWRTPKHGWLKLNTDGAAKGNTGHAGAGGVIRDHFGNAILAFHEYIGKENSLFAEVHALLKGLELAKSNGINKLWIETDARGVLHLISTATHGHWKLQEMLAKSKYIMRQMETTITHICREGNKVADFLANEACITQTSRVLTPTQLTGPITGLLRVDQMGIPSFRLG